MATIKALTLHQPWATLIAIGAKRVETRSWPTRYRGPLAIHAGKGAASLSAVSPQWQAIMAEFDRAGVSPLALQRGVVVAVCRLDDCWPITDAPSGPEAYFGDYTPGRYAWALSDVRVLDEPVPMRGRQGLWNVDVAVC